MGDEPGIIVENKKPAQSADSSESRYDTRESGLVPAIMIAVQKTLSRVCIMPPKIRLRRHFK